MTTPKPIGILIIDDNEMTRTVLRMIIHGEEYNVVGEAVSGEIGFDKALKLQPDIICLDIVMPKENGLDVLARIKEILPQTAVLMVTASSDRQTVNSAISRGASGFIVKPFNAGVVLDTLAKTVAQLKLTK